MTEYLDKIAAISLEVKVEAGGANKRCKVNAIWAF